MTPEQRKLKTKYLEQHGCPYAEPPSIGEVYRQARSLTGYMVVLLVGSFLRCRSVWRRSVINIDPILALVHPADRADRFHDMFTRHPEHHAVGGSRVIVIRTLDPLVVNCVQVRDMAHIYILPLGETSIRAVRMDRTINAQTRAKIYALGELWLSHADGQQDLELVLPRPWLP